MRHTVSESDTAASLSSGDVPVLGTPRLIAWMEAATVDAAAGLLGPGQTSVGTAIRVEHRRATPIGDGVAITVTGPARAGDGRRLTFTVQAHDDAGRLVGAGEIDRVIVDRDRFLASIASP